jgi:hypothetical protein
VQTTFIFNYLSIPNFILGGFGGFEKPVGQFRPNVQYLALTSPISSVPPTNPLSKTDNINILPATPPRSVHNLNYQIGFVPPIPSLTVPSAHARITFTIVSRQPSKKKAKQQ